MTWQPISTAPKDKLVDIWLDSGERWCGCYYDNICDQWRTSRPSGHLMRIYARHVTHWMAIPEPPSPQLDLEDAIAETREPASSM